CSQLLISISSFVMFIVMYIFYLQNQVNVYHVITAVVLMLSSFGPVMALSNLANNLLFTLSSGRRVMAILEEKEAICEVTGQPHISFDDIHVDDVTFAYQQDDPILQNLHLHFDKGKVTGINGKSGSGKSTLLKLLMRFYDPLRGVIQIGQTPLTNINTSNMRHMFAYVTQ